MSDRKRTLVVRYDVSGLDEDAIGALMLEAQAQGEASNDHPDVDVKLVVEDDEEDELEANVFVVEVRALADRLWELRRDYQPDNRGPESPSATLSSRLLASFASYLACVADDDDINEATLSGLVGHLRVDITAGIDALVASGAIHVVSSAAKEWAAIASAIVASAIKIQVDAFSDLRMNGEAEMRTSVARTANAIAAGLEATVGFDKFEFAKACGLCISNGRDTYSDCQPGELTWEIPR